jgi:2-polyprenyl-3-methyl-5-hydroxy-6-metoxy-1,4-benzoquinol methylase
MPKKILFESAVHQFLWAAKRKREQLQSADPVRAERFRAWVSALTIENPGGGRMRVAWQDPRPDEHFIELKNAHFYTRGDAEPHYRRQAEAGLPFATDRIMEQNAAFFDGEVRTVLAQAGLTVETGPNLPAAAGVAARKHAEEVFHDQWAAGVDVASIDIRRMNEACTAPEMRHITAALGDLRGRALLDVGCGLGEAAVYFALQGARVTATDISPGMCDATRRLAAANGVDVVTHVSAAEDLGLAKDRQFDIIYTGNTLHHADLAAMLDSILPHLKPDGVFASWDPVAYNPVINIYRAIATKVRTADEHPLRLRDVHEVTGRFERAEVKWFWLTALLIFMIMAVVQFRSPNQERYWKKVIEEADRWAWLYRPLAALDRGLLKILPFLAPLCWNVVIVGRHPKNPTVR